jgi:hypothetical protein
MSYHVNVTREGDQWLAEVPGMAGAHTYAGNLVALDQRVREVIALVEDLPEGSEPGLDLAWDYTAVGEEIVAAARVGEEHRRIEAARRADTERIRAEIKRLAQRYSTRDIAGLLHVTPGYVSQVTTAA